MFTARKSSRKAKSGPLQTLCLVGVIWLSWNSTDGIGSESNLLSESAFTGKLASENDEDLFRLGTTHYSRGQWDFAIQRFEQLLELSENKKLRALSRFYLGESLVAAKKLERAQAELKQFVADNPGHELLPQAQFRLGEICFLADDHENARNALGEFVTDFPQHPLLEYALPYLGEIEVKRGNLRQGTEWFEKSLKMFPGGKLANESRFGLARVLGKQGADKEATRFYQYLIDHPESGRKADCLLQLGKMAFRSANYEQSVKWLSQFEREYPQHELLGPVKYWIGRSRMEKGELKAAEDSFREGIQSNPDSEVLPALRYELGKCLVEQNRFVDAVAYLDSVIADFGQTRWADDAMLMQIQVMRNTERYESAIEICRQFHRKFPNSELQRLVLESEAECFFSAQDFTGAETLFALLLKQQSDNQGLEEDAARSKEIVSAWKYKLAVCLIKQEKTREALDILEKVDWEQAEQTVRSAAQLSLATIQIERKQFAAASKNLTRYIEENPGKETVQKCVIDLSLLLAKRGDYQSADRWVQKISDAEISASTLIQLADIAFAQSNFLFASEWYSTAVSRTRKRDLKLLGMMGNVWSAKESGSIESAIILADRISTSFPNAEQAADAIYLSAVLNQKSGNSGRALVGFEKIVTRYPRSEHFSESLLALASLYRNSQPRDLPKLIAPLRKALKSNQVVGNDAESSRFALEYELAWILKETGQREEAIDSFRAIAESGEKTRLSNEAELQVAMMLYESDSEKRTAIDMLKALSKKRLAPKLAPVVFYQLGQVSFENNDYAAAESSFSKIMERYSEFGRLAEATFWAGEANYLLGEYGKSAKIFAKLGSELTKDHPFKIRSLIRLGQVSIKLEKWNRALETAEEALGLELEGNESFQVNFVRARAYSGLGLFSKARAAYQLVLENRDARGTETAAMAQWMIGETWLHQDDLDKAIDAYQKTEILHAYPEWQAAALLQAGRCFLDKKQMGHARECFERVVNKLSETGYASAAQAELDDFPIPVKQPKFRNASGPTKLRNNTRNISDRKDAVDK